MESALANPQQLDEIIDRYEAAQKRGSPPDLAGFLPERDHPLYLPVLRELVRVDLEYSWQRGQPHALDDYQRRFPELFQDSASLNEVAFEEYRLRQQAGENPSPEDYKERFRLSTHGWPRWTRAPQTDPAAPASRSRDEALQAAQAYQDFRLHYPALKGPDLDAWLTFFAGSRLFARLFRDLHGGDSASAAQLAEALTRMPQAGSDFLGFQLLTELGRGAFGRVFLARQGDLAQRLVALKVTPACFGESQALAQLQHTHIVPVYSLHRAGLNHAVCMPYFGPCTLAHLLETLHESGVALNSGKQLVNALVSRSASIKATFSPEPGAAPPELPQTPAMLARLEGMTYPEAVLWLGARMAEGLAHAHDRGIIHRDLKPANVLITDEGCPMVLDFNLSQDTKLRNHPAATQIGGTLPYMAPEHLLATGGNASRVDSRSDVYALGVILHEMLTGHLPFPARRGDLEDILPSMLADRRQVPRLRPGNAGITPAVEAIVRHCLEPDPANRYQSARNLQEDLDRHLEHRPLLHQREPSIWERLRKWQRRHPRLTSGVNVALLALIFLTALGGVMMLRERRLQELEAVDSLRHFRAPLHQMQFQLLDPGTALAEDAAGCRALLQKFQVLDDPNWRQTSQVRHMPESERRQLGEDIAELLLLWSWATVTQSEADSGRRPSEAAAWEALRLNQAAETCFAPDAVPRAVWKQRTALSQWLGNEADAQHWRGLAERTPIRRPRDLCLLAGEFTSQNRFRAALPLLEEATRLDPQNFWGWFDLGLCQEGLGQDAAAAACFTTCIALEPRFAPLYWKRGAAWHRQQLYARAEADFAQAMQLRPGWTEVLVDQALARQSLRRHAEAIEDLDLALRQGAAPVRVFLIQAQVRKEAGDAAGAQRDFDAALRRAKEDPPTDERSWLALGDAWIERGQSDEALACFQRALQLNPRSLGALQNLAYLLAQDPARTEEAKKVLDQLLTYYPDNHLARANRGVLLARLGRCDEARADAQCCEAPDSPPAIEYRIGCIFALIAGENADDRSRAFSWLSRALKSGYGIEWIDKDPDLDPIRNDAGFAKLRSLTQLGP